MEAEFEDGFFSIDELLNEDNIEFSESESAPELETHSMPQVQPEENVRKHKAQLTMEKKRQIVDEMLILLHNSSLPRGSMARFARHFGVHKSTITRLFKEICNQMAQGNIIDVRSKKLGKCGPKARQYTEEWLQSVPLYLRTTERSYAAALKISRSTLHSLKKRGILRTHTSTNHPRLTSDHKIARLRWVLSHIEPATRNSNPTFVDMKNVIHIDEKWFFLNPETRRFYLLPKEEDPYRCQQSRRFKVKAMFMGVIGKPLYDAQGHLIHDGKYGIFPFVVHQVAKKRSKNREAGTVETKAVEHINKEAIRGMLLNHVIPAIISKWPANMPKEVVVQWDSARPHQVPTDEEFIQATTQGGFNIKFVFQPAQSPDLNVLDLGLFGAIQSLQYQTFPRNLDELIEKVKEAYDAFEPVVNKYTWITLQTYMIEILKVQGGNNYKAPHMGKQKLSRLGMLPEQLEVSTAIINQAVNHLNTIFREINEENLQQQIEQEVDAD